MAKSVAILSLLLIAAAGCRRNSPQQFQAAAQEFVYTTLAFSPSAATQVGLHSYNNQNLDDLLDDMSSANLDRQRQYYERFRTRLDQFSAAQLSPEDRADLAVIRDQIELSLLDLNEIHSQLHAPQMYVETLGNALFEPFVLDYAPLPVRFRNIISRLQKVPLFLDQASTNLTSAPDIWTTVAMQENQGNLDLVDKTLRAAAPPELRQSYDQAAQTALNAMQKFQDYLKNRLTARADYDWRLGADRYTKKFRYTLDAGVEPSSALQSAERELTTDRARMMELSLPLHRTMFPGHGEHNDLSGDARVNRVVREVLDKIAERHSTPASFKDDVRKDYEAARAFVQEKHLLTLPARANLQVIDTPEFMRGIYAVAGFAAAPPLEPQLGAFYWVTPIPANWPKDRVDSKLRENNFYTMKQLTIHEAMPGHYVQFEVANDIQPQTRRVLRNVFGNGPYIEGWAFYVQQMMTEQGFPNPSPEMELAFLKQDLRVLANTILDVRLQMLNMTDQEALDLMEQQTFQEKEEATAKLQRAKLSSAQLPTYFVGSRAWVRLRDQHKQAKGAAFSLSGFHDRALKEGPVPMPVLEELLK